jgi:hypothetical protein
LSCKMGLKEYRKWVEREIRNKCRNDENGSD